MQGGPIQSISQAGAGVHQPPSCVQGLFGKAIAWAKAIVAGHRLWTVVQRCLGCLTAIDPAKYVGWPCLPARISPHFAGEEVACTGLRSKTVSTYLSWLLLLPSLPRPEPRKEVKAALADHGSHRGMKHICHEVGEKGKGTPHTKGIWSVIQQGGKDAWNEGRSHADV